ncbi:MAG: UbiX family flavin prenyltransferase [Conexivisphaera sp.]
MDRYVVGLSGASGVIYGVRLVRALLDSGHEVHAVVSDAARLTARYELDGPLEEALAGARLYGEDQLDAPLSSGSFPTRGMVIAPCSMRTLAAVAHGIEDNLLVRAAMVHLKERRRLVLLVRETPLSTVHIENMLRASSAGAVIMPASPGFYGRPRTIGDLVDSVVGRVLDILGIENALARRWTGPDQG